MYNWDIIIDVLIVVLIIFTIITNAKKGFIKTALNAIKGILVLLLALALTPMTSDIAKDNFVNGWFEGTITTPFVETALEAGENFNFETISENLPDVADGVISLIDVDGALSQFEGTGVDFAMEFGGRLEGLVINVVSNIITYVFWWIILSIVLTIIVKLLEKTVELPVLKQGDHILGGIWGVVSAYVEISLCVVVLAFFGGFEFIENTVVARFFYENGLFSTLFNTIL